MYGIGEKATDNFGRQCLMARRLCENGVRFVQVTSGAAEWGSNWDQHSKLSQHEAQAKAVDKPIAGLLQDLKQRGLLEDTIVWFSGEFGRTPYAQKNGTGRDHNAEGFTTWLAGDCLKVRLRLRFHGRVRAQSGREQGPHARSTRHVAAPAGTRSRTPHLSIRGSRFPTDRRAWQGRQSDHQLAEAVQPLLQQEGP